MHQQPCHMLLGGSVMRTEMHGSRTRHRGSRLAPPSARVGGDVTTMMMREVLLLSHFLSTGKKDGPRSVLSSAVLFYFYFFANASLSVCFFSRFANRLCRIGAGCCGRQEDAFPQLRQHTQLPGHPFTPGPVGCHGPGPRAPVAASGWLGQTLEQPGG